MRRSPAPFLPLVLAGALSACDGASGPKTAVDAGYASIGRGAYADAERSFRQALEELEPGSAQWERAKSGQLDALAHTDPARAADELLALRAARPLELDGDYLRCAHALLDAKAPDEAARVLRAAWRDHEGAEQLLPPALDAMSGGDEDAAAKLRDLGYVAGADNGGLLDDEKTLREVIAFLEGADETEIAPPAPSASRLDGEPLNVYTPYVTDRSAPR